MEKETAPVPHQYKIKSKLINKFFNEPVEALDLRLTKFEEIFSIENWCDNPLTQIKQEEDEPTADIPLDYSEVRLVTPEPHNDPELDEPPVMPDLQRLPDLRHPPIPPLIDHQTTAAADADYQRVILKPSQGSPRRRSPYARYSPYHDRHFTAGVHQGHSADNGFHRSFLRVPELYTYNPTEPMAVRVPRRSPQPPRSESPKTQPPFYRKNLLRVGSPEDMYIQQAVFDHGSQASPRNTYMEHKRDQYLAEGSWSNNTRISEQPPRRVSVIESATGPSFSSPSSWQPRHDFSPRVNKQEHDLESRIAMVESSQLYAAENPLLQRHNFSTRNIQEQDLDSQITLAESSRLYSTQNQLLAVSPPRSPTPRLSSPPPRYTHQQDALEMPSPHSLLQSSIFDHFGQNKRSPLLRPDNPNLGSSSFRVAPSQEYLRRTEELLDHPSRTEEQHHHPSRTEVHQHNPLRKEEHHHPSRSEVHLHHASRKEEHLHHPSRTDEHHHPSRTEEHLHHPSRTQEYQLPPSCDKPQAAQRQSSVIVRHQSEPIKAEPEAAGTPPPPVTSSDESQNYPRHLFEDKHFQRSWLNLHAAARMHLVQENMRLKSNAVANGDGGGPIRLGPLMNRFPVPYFRPPDFSRLPGFDNKAKFQENQNIRWQQPKFVPAAGPMERPKTEVSSSMTKMAAEEIEDEEDTGTSSKGKRGRPRKHAPKIPLPPLYVFIRNMLHNAAYNPTVISWVDEDEGCFKVTSTSEFAKTWGKMKSNRSEEMNYEKMSRAMRYHYGSKRQGRKGHLAMVKEKRLFYRFGELAVNWRPCEMAGLLPNSCSQHDLCKNDLCLWTKE